MKNQNWTPCKEDLPKTDKEVLCSCVDHNGEEFVEQGSYHTGDWLLAYDSYRLGILDRKIVAWQPLPETYHSEKETQKQSVDKAYLCDWFINSVDNDDPIWTEEHIEELLKDFLIIPRRGK